MSFATAYTATEEAMPQTPMVKAAPCLCGQVRFVFISQFACWEKCPHCGDYLLHGWSSVQTPVMVLTS
jgi:hypothetical protein